MNSEYYDLLGFLGYGEPNKSIWFIANEEQGPITEGDNQLWEKWLHEKCQSEAQVKVTLDERTVPIRFTPWRKGDEDKYPGYRRCARVVEMQRGLTRSEETWKQALLVNLFILPSINEDKGKNWTPWLSTKLGADKWTWQEYVINVRKARSIILAEAAARYRPEAIITMGIDAGTLLADPDFQRRIGGIQPAIQVTQAICHPAQRALNSLRLSDDDWIVDLVQKVKNKASK